MRTPAPFLIIVGMKKAVFAMLCVLSILCVTFLGLLYLYSGSIFPSTQAATAGEARWIWFEWALIPAVPVGTACWCLLKLGARKPP